MRVFYNIIITLSHEQISAWHFSVYELEQILSPSVCSRLSWTSAIRLIIIILWDISNNYNFKQTTEAFLKEKIEIEQKTVYDKKSRTKRFYAQKQHIIKLSTNSKHWKTHTSFKEDPQS